MNLKKLVFASVALMMPLLVNADNYDRDHDHDHDGGEHRFYLHALYDLRTARWLLENRPADGAANSEKALAVREIDAAIGEIKRASIDDGRDIGDHAQIDVPPDAAGNFHQALDLLQKVQSDVANEADDRVSQRLHYRAGRHIDGAIRATEHAIRDLEHHR